MVFSSIPPYLDPSNWQQQPNYQSGNPQLPPPPPLQPDHVGGGLGSIRPGSMADRARMAHMPIPEAAQKCPRCESTNTKFCYFNNYSLSQPRHFCKTCRRYWTRGGALRSVPVGGGYRRNKRISKANNSKSPVRSDSQTAPYTEPTLSSTSTGSTASMLGLSPQIPSMPSMPPLHHLNNYGPSHISWNYNGISAQPLATDRSWDRVKALMASSTSGGSYLSAGGFEQWQLQQTQLSLLGGLDGQSGPYPFQGGTVESSSYGGEMGQLVRPKLPSSGLTQPGFVKMEENRELNMSRQFLRNQGNDQYWTDLSGFSTPYNNPM